MMRSVIIDDEEANVGVLECLLGEYCPQIVLVGAAYSADEGYRLILEHKPDFVFLDVNMPNKNGFDLLRMFDKIDFQVIFVTAHDEYAIQAFEFSAVDYLLKPIDHEKMIRSVKRAEHNLLLNENFIRFIDSVDQQSQLLQKIPVHKNDVVTLLDIHEISYLEALGNYCEVITKNKQKYLSSKTLLAYEQLLDSHTNFLRINRKTLINVFDIHTYSKGPTCFITLKSTNEGFEVSRRKKNEILQILKGYQLETA